jgi:hypothetical protein
VKVCSRWASATGWTHQGRLLAIKSVRLDALDGPRAHIVALDDHLEARLALEVLDKATDARDPHNPPTKAALPRTFGT